MFFAVMDPSHYYYALAEEEHRLRLETFNMASPILFTEACKTLTERVSDKRVRAILIKATESLEGAIGKNAKDKLPQIVNQVFSSSDFPYFSQEASRHSEDMAYELIQMAAAPDRNDFMDITRLVLDAAHEMRANYPDNENYENHYSSIIKNAGNVMEVLEADEAVYTHAASRQSYGYNFLKAGRHMLQSAAGFVRSAIDASRAIKKREKKLNAMYKEACKANLG